MDLLLSGLWGIAAVGFRLAMTLHATGAARSRSAATTAGRSLFEMAVPVLVVVVLDTLVRAIIKTDAESILAAKVFAAIVAASFVGAATVERSRIRGSITLATLAGVLASTLIELDFRVFHLVRGYSTLIATSVGVGAISAIVAARVLGPRKGKHNRDGSTNFIPPHNVPMFVAGDLLMLAMLPLAASWGAVVSMPLLVCSSATLVAASAVLARRSQRIELTAASVAMVAGGVIGACLIQLQLEAILLALAVGLVLPLLMRKSELKLKLDDPSMLAVPLLLAAIAGAAVGASSMADHPQLANVGSGGGYGDETPRIGSPWSEAGLALLSMTLKVGVAGAISFVVAFALNKLGWLRVSASDESDGLDLARHDVNAYPDFQQTMIKSYHLRQ